MSATNATTNYSLPLFIGTDKPAWLVDWNGAMSAIDAQMKVNATDILANTTAISSLSTTVSTHTTSISTISGQITTLSTGLNTAQGNINTINSLIGNGEPTTTDKTLIGAINEIYGMITGGGSTEIQAANVSFDGTASGLVATTVQAAIEEVYAAIPATSSVNADDVSYDNTASGLTATNVQDAIDELASNPSDAPVVLSYSDVFVNDSSLKLDTSTLEFIGVKIGKYVHIRIHGKVTVSTSANTVIAVLKDEFEAASPVPTFNYTHGDTNVAFGGIGLDGNSKMVNLKVSGTASANAWTIIDFFYVLK